MAKSSLNMGNLTDDKAEELLVLVWQIAGLQIYGTEVPFPGEGETDTNDAVDCLNGLIEQARALLG